MKNVSIGYDFLFNNETGSKLDSSEFSTLEEEWSFLNLLFGTRPSGALLANTLHPEGERSQKEGLKKDHSSTTASPVYRIGE